MRASAFNLLFTRFDGDLSTYVQAILFLCFFVTAYVTDLTAMISLTFYISKSVVQIYKQ